MAVILVVKSTEVREIAMTTVVSAGPGSSVVVREGNGTTIVQVGSKPVTLVVDPPRRKSIIAVAGIGPHGGVGLMDFDEALRRRFHKA